MDESVQILHGNVLFYLKNNFYRYCIYALNHKLINLQNNQEIDIEYFIKDNKKTGGKYIRKVGIIKKIDYVSKKIILIDKTIIPIENIINIK